MLKSTRQNLLKVLNMNIRKKVIISFIILMVFIIAISLLGLINTYQIKEDSSFAKDISKLIRIQEDMNDVIHQTINEENIENLKAIKNNFVQHEKTFEALRKEITKKDRKDFLDSLLNDIHQNRDIEKSLVLLFENEHSIELIFDEIYDIQTKKLIYAATFEDAYPKENSKRKTLQVLIFKTENLYLIQEFGNLKYYSKETLYQHRDEERFQKWLDSIDKIQKVVKKDGSLVALLGDYKETVNNIGKLAIAINGVETAEKELVSKLTEILTHNKNESVLIEEKINDISEKFLNKVSIIQSSLIFIIFILTALLTVYISSKLSSIINKLNRGVKSVSEGEYDTHIIIDEDKEFGKIADTFNTMSKNIKAHNETLEEKIRLRTKELEGALKDVENKKDLLENLSNKLAKYLSPQIFESIFSGQQDVVLESKRKFLTVFFSDVKGFTDLTDTVEPETLTNLLNEYLDVMSTVAIKYGGTIDKFIGDAIMIFFGDPSTEGKKEDALKCIQMALEMKAQMSKLRIKWQNDGISKPFHIRIGVNSGVCTVGNFGTKNRLDYTIIGGVVNLASRLESNSDPDEILISDETYMLVKEKIICTKKGEISLKGISRPMETYQVVANEENTIIEEQNGFQMVIDLNEIDREKVVKTLEDKINCIKNRNFTDQ